MYSVQHESYSFIFMFTALEARVIDFLLKIEITIPTAEAMLIISAAEASWRRKKASKETIRIAELTINGIWCPTTEKMAQSLFLWDERI